MIMDWEVLVLTCAVLIVGGAAAGAGWSLLQMLAGYLARRFSGREAWAAWIREHGVAAVVSALWAVAVVLAWRRDETGAILPGLVVAFVVFWGRHLIDWRRRRIVGAERSRAAETVLAFDPPRNLSPEPARSFVALQQRMAAVIRQGVDPEKAERRGRGRRMAGRD